MPSATLSVFDKVRTRLEGDRAFNALEAVILDVLERMTHAPNAKVEKRYAHLDKRLTGPRTPFRLDLLGETTLVGGFYNVGGQYFQWTKYTYEDLNKRVLGYDLFLSVSDTPHEERGIALNLRGDSVTQRQDEERDFPYRFGLHESVREASASRSWQRLLEHFPLAGALDSEEPTQLAARIASASERGARFCQLNEAQALVAVRLMLAVFAKASGART